MGYRRELKPYTVKRKSKYFLKKRIVPRSHTAIYLRKKYCECVKKDLPYEVSRWLRLDGTMGGGFNDTDCALYLTHTEGVSVPSMWRKLRAALRKYCDRPKRRKGALDPVFVEQIDRRKATTQNAPFSREHEGHYFQKVLGTPYLDIARREVQKLRDQGFNVHFIKWGRNYVIYQGLGRITDRTKYGLTIKEE